MLSNRTLHEGFKSTATGLMVYYLHSLVNWAVFVTHLKDNLALQEDTVDHHNNPKPRRLFQNMETDLLTCAAVHFIAS